MASVTYAVKIKNAAIDKKKNKENKVVNAWLDGIAEDAQRKAKNSVFSRVDLSQASIPPSVVTAVNAALTKNTTAKPKPASTKALGEAASGGGSSSASKASDPDGWLILCSILWDAFETGVTFKKEDRARQATELNEVLQKAKWGTNDRPTLDTATGLPVAK